MTSFDTTRDGRPLAGELPEAEIIDEVDSRGGKRALVLKVKIEGQHRTFLLRLDALEGRGLLGPAAVEELRGIRIAVEALAGVERKRNQ